MVGSFADGTTQSDSAESDGRHREVISAEDQREYDEWISRVCSTYEAVFYTCTHRLRDPGLAESVAVQVAAGLVSRPTVFRYFGLPYSGRIAKLAEARIAEAQQGTLARVCEWSRLQSRIRQVSLFHRSVFVSVCVRGDDSQSLARHLDCDVETADLRRSEMLAFMHRLAGPGLSSELDDDGEVHF